MYSNANIVTLCSTLAQYFLHITLLPKRCEHIFEKVTFAVKDLYCQSRDPSDRVREMFQVMTGEYQFTARMDILFLRTVRFYDVHLLGEERVRDGMRNVFEDMKDSGHFISQKPTVDDLVARLTKVLTTPPSKYPEIILHTRDSFPHISEVRSLIENCVKDRLKQKPARKGGSERSPPAVRPPRKRAGGIVMVSDDEIEVARERPSKRQKETATVPSTKGEPATIEEAGLTRKRAQPDAGCERVVLNIEGQEERSAEGSDDELVLSDLSSDIKQHPASSEPKRRKSDVTPTITDLWPKGPCNNEFESRVALKKLQVIEERERLEHNVRRFRIEQEMKNRRFELEEKWKERREKRSQISKLMSILLD